MTSSSTTFTAASGYLQYDGPLRFHPDSDLGDFSLTFDDGDLSQAETVSLDGGTSYTPFEIISSGTTSPKSNNNFYKNFDEFSSGEPPYYVVIAIGDQQYILFPDDPAAMGDLDGNVQLDEAEPICFVAGTLILTAQGERPIETLVAGDMVVTRDHGLAPLRWIGMRRMAVTPAIAPIRITAGALGPNMPEQDLSVSPQHRVLLRGARAEMLFGAPEVLVAARHLVDDARVVRDTGARQVTYVHLMFDAHEVIYTQGLQSESLQAGPVGLASLEPEHRAEVLAIFPELEQQSGTRPAVRPELKRREAALLVR
ncbi:hypothetical protein CBW24_14440 [Pacificitalea manganoxidans]|uniref:Hedgehog/Intein (Hint) domain-containing protein n=1 Tax=Pacificitalea manganoxidans TaxID=1411902 RepID=A0A291M2G0_9RHOB|nr:Hint domain-containing protein [Pacificitalea manganoxidans]ATI43084.1 hypothetical protein CBW24_14440 [Pacificitalea manganoxidans]MDR6306981.1 hypothetical protein [Pacificitalea manganoxidans]